ncbi:hypothetical protein Tco_1046196 [Tanacetum coccineum]
MPPKRTSTSATPTVTQDTIRQLITDSVATTLKAQAANMANTDNTNKNTGTSGTPVTRKGTNNHKQKFVIEGTLLPTTTTTTPTIATTTTTKITATITSVTMITINRIEGKKPSGLMLPPMGILETVLYVKGAPCII